MSRMFVLYDGRAKIGNTDDAAVLTVEITMGKARLACNSFRGEDAVWFEYDVSGEKLVNERRCPELNKLL